MPPPMTEISSTPRRSTRWIWLLLVLAMLAALALAGWRGWEWWQARNARALAEQSETQLQLQALQQNLETLRRDQRATVQRVQDAASTNRVLRDEMLGLSQRSALLEDNVAKLADSNRHGAQALRLDEVELLLSQGQQRLDVAGDTQGARRAYALASDVLEGVDDPRYLNLRQVLLQERTALDALGEARRRGCRRSWTPSPPAWTPCPHNCPSAPKRRYGNGCCRRWSRSAPPRAGCWSRVRSGSPRATRCSWT